MRRYHDMGGQPAGPIDTADHAMEPWAKTLTAMVSALRAQSLSRVDELRRHIEDLAPQDYDRPYFARWAEAFCDLLEEKGFTSRAEIEARMAAIKAELAARPALQRAVGESELRLRAVRVLAITCYEQAWAIVCAGRTLPPRVQAELRSVATFATEVAVDVTTQAFRYSGGTALYMTHVLQRCLRDINAAAQHLMVSDAAYENYGQCLLGLPDADPMR